VKTPRDRELEREIADILSRVRKVIARDKHRARARAWYVRNAEKHRALVKAYRQKNADAVKKWREDWNAKHPHYHRDWSRIKRARGKA